MKDYNVYARTWLETHGMTEHLALRAELLGKLFEEAYEEGRRAEAKRWEVEGSAREGLVLREEADAPEGSFDSIVSARQHEELTQKTIKILGSNRSREALRNVPHLRRAVAMHAQVDVGVLRAYLDGQPVRTHLAAMILKSLRELGIWPGEGQGR